MVTIEDVRPVALALPRATEALVRGRVKFRVGRIVYLAFSRDETVMGFAFPKEWRDALTAQSRTSSCALYLIVYGSKAEADRAAETVQAVHAFVRGTTQARLGTFPVGTSYSAADPELMLWVHATLVETSLTVYHRSCAVCG